jgi:flagellar hook assembly protein FlgD
MIRFPLISLAALLIIAAGCDDTSYPFDSVTDPFTFTYELAQDGNVDVLVLNSYVTTVRELLADSVQSAGSHSLGWDLTDDEGNRVPDGLYYVRIILDDHIVETQMYEVYQ